VPPKLTYAMEVLWLYQPTEAFLIAFRWDKKASYSLILDKDVEPAHAAD